MALDLVGIVDPTPISDGASALISLARGNWLDAVLSGVSMVPYVGDLAKAGKLPRYLKSVERAFEISRRMPSVADALRPGMRELQKALQLFPPNGNMHIQTIRRKVAEFLQEFDSATPAVFSPPDIRRHHRHYVSRSASGRRLEVSEGRLGVPGRVRQHRDRNAQGRVAEGTGDDAGHRIGNQFGASGREENLARQSWMYNRTPKGEHVDGTPWKKLEEQWARKLENGIGIEVRVVDEFLERGRPFARRVEWTEIDTLGYRTMHSRAFINPTTERSLRAAGQDVPRAGIMIQFPSAP